jgi:hypothetical protein
MSKPIGGFFELELRRGGAPYHAAAVALGSGRASLRHILDVTRPVLAWVPFYVCDAALRPFEEAGISVEFYSLDDELDPLLPTGAPADGECLLYINYFGMKTSRVLALVAAHPGRVIVDDTHAFYSTGYAGAWSFNSARKFFGVPDGSYAYGPGLSRVERPRVPEVHYDHLVNRLLGRQDLAYAQYLRSEAAVTTDPWRMSVLSERLLAQVDYDEARQRRRRNFTVLHEAFGGRNCLRRLLLLDTEVPYCYPLLSSAAVPWTAVWNQGVFAPRLWPEVLERPRSTQFVRESTLAERLLPLPIDHRYGADDLACVIDVVTGVMQW